MLPRHQYSIHLRWSLADCPDTLLRAPQHAATLTHRAPKGTRDLLQPVHRIDGRVMWSNLVFLFCLSLFPFSAAWLNKAQPRPSVVPTVFYGITLLLTAISWGLLARALINANGGSGSELHKALGTDRKTAVSIVPGDAVEPGVLLGDLWLEPGLECRHEVPCR